jgi:hypothetical protein
MSSTSEKQQEQVMPRVLMGLFNILVIAFFVKTETGPYKGMIDLLSHPGNTFTLEQMSVVPIMFLMLRWDSLKGNPLGFVTDMIWFTMLAMGICLLALELERTPEFNEMVANRTKLWIEHYNNMTNNN